MFDSRSSKGKGLENQVIEQLSDWGFLVAKNGTEHTHPRFVNKLKRSNDETSLMIRYSPDAVIAIGKEPISAYIEAKNSVHIEKNAYFNYMRLFKDGGVVYLVAKTEHGIMFDQIQHIRTSYSHNPWEFPLDDDMWIAPRLNPQLLERARKNGFKGSGTPYRLIEVKHMFEWNKSTFLSYFDN